jgi:3-hydroxybutyryl-CoA dehydratase
MKAGDVEIAERTFTIEDVRAFTAISGDRGRHHVEPDAQGRLLVHGLLTATLFTEVGGRLNYLAREMKFEFIRPVHTGDHLRVEMVIDEVEEQEGRTSLSASAVCKNQHGKEVMKALTNGVILTKRAS